MAGDVRRALDRSIREAVKQGLIDRQLYAGAIAAARALADKIDAWDVIVGWALDDAADSGGRPAVPQNDNVSLASFLKYVQALRLVPAPVEAASKGAQKVAPQSEIDAWRERQQKAV